jgi:hypothetical protein
LGDSKVSVKISEHAEVGVIVGVFVIVGVAVRVGVMVKVGVLVGVFVGGAGENVFVTVGVWVIVGVRVIVGVCVGVWVIVGVFVGPDEVFVGVGVAGSLQRFTLTSSTYQYVVTELSTSALKNNLMVNPAYCESIANVTWVQAPFVPLSSVESNVDKVLPDESRTSTSKKS